MGAVVMWMLLWGPFALAVLVGVLLHLQNRGSRVPLPARLRVISALAGGVPAVIIGLAPVALFLWRPGLGMPLEMRALLPLLLGIASATLLTAPRRRRRAPAAADLSPRGMRAFVPRAWPTSMAVLAVAIIAITIAAGSASSPDEFGRFTEYSIVIGTSGTEIRSGIYGWYYSVPSLIALAALVVVTVVAWASISHPAWDDDVEHDAALRRFRSSLVGRAALGALLTHLSVVLRSLASTASMEGTAASAELGEVSVGTPFAAIAPALTWTAYAAVIAGLTLWVMVALSALPARARRHAEPVAE